MSTSSDGIVVQAESESPTVTVNRTESGDVCGAVIFLDGDDLESLGIETEGAFTYTVADEHLRIETEQQ